MVARPGAFLASVLLGISREAKSPEALGISQKDIIRTVCNYSLVSIYSSIISIQIGAQIPYAVERLKRANCRRDTPSVTFAGIYMSQISIHQPIDRHKANSHVRCENSDLRYES